MSQAGQDPNEPPVGTSSKQEPVVVKRAAKTVTAKAAKPESQGGSEQAEAKTARSAKAAAKQKPAATRQTAAAASEAKPAQTAAKARAKAKQEPIKVKRTPKIKAGKKPRG